MKKFFLSALVLSICFFSCQREPVEQPEEEPNTYSVVGFWENGDYFLSLNEEGFLISYVAPKFLDCGNYSINDNVILCENTFFIHNTRYEITNLDENEMSLKVTYNNLQGENIQTDITLYKTNKIPAVKDNPLIGKSLPTLSQYFGTVTYSFTTFQTGMKTGLNNAANYPLTLFYIYHNNYVYIQTFDFNNSPAIGAWNNQHVNNGDIFVDSVSFAPNGGISNLITLHVF